MSFVLLYRELKSSHLVQGKCHPEGALLVITLLYLHPYTKGCNVVYAVRVPEPLSEYLMAELE
jgi:hypothetical protein